MEISQEKLQELVIKALKELGYYNDTLITSASTTKIYMVCLSCFDEKYIEFMENMDKVQGFEVYPVVPNEFFTTEHNKSFEKFLSCKKVISRNEFEYLELENVITVFPIVTKDIVAKTALCISDTFENKCINNCIEKGSKLVFMLSGLPKFTGKESQAYIENLLSYYRTILKYNIDITEGYDFNSNKGLVSKIQSFDKNTKTEFVNTNTNWKKVITATDLYKYPNASVIKLNYGDIVTELAKENAEKMGITFERM